MLLTCMQALFRSGIEQFPAFVNHQGIDQHTTNSCQNRRIHHLVRQKEVHGGPNPNIEWDHGQAEELREVEIGVVDGLRSMASSPSVPLVRWKFLGVHV